MCSPLVLAGKAQMHLFHVRPVTAATAVLHMCLRLRWIQDAACVAAAAANVVAASAVTKIPSSFPVVRATLASFAQAVAAWPSSPAPLGPKLAVATGKQLGVAAASSHWHAGSCPGRDAARRNCDSASLRLAMYGQEVLGQKVGVA